MSDNAINLNPSEFLKFFGEVIDFVSFLSMETMFIPELGEIIAAFLVELTFIFDLVSMEEKI